jgi:hypothetical protein
MKLVNFIQFLIIAFLIGCKTEEPQNPPTVITKVASDVTIKNVTLNGEVIDEGFSSTSERGFIISDKNSTPTVNDTKVLSGSGKGVFSIVLDKLSVNTTYYFKAYATNTKGSSYGEVQSFTSADYSLASITTELAKNITLKSAEVVGNISNEGGGSVTERGFCIGLNPSPTISDNKFPVANKGSGSFALVIINLKENTKYYVRSYALNEKGFAYGNEQNFTTLDFKLPTVSTGTISDFSYTSASSTGNIVEDGGAPILESGFCVSENNNPTISDSKFKVSSTKSDFTAILNNLKENTTYYVRAYAQNVKGFAYGNQITFKTRLNPLNTSLKNGLQIFYPFNGNTKDESGNGYNGTGTSIVQTTDRFGLDNSAYYFDGKLNTKITSEFEGILGSKSRSISLWMKKNNDFNTEFMVNWGVAAGQGAIIGANYGVFIGKWVNNLPFVGVDNGGSVVGTSYKMISDNKWHHYAFVYDETLGQNIFLVKIYIDGVYFPLEFSFNPSNINTKKSSNVTLGEYENIKFNFNKFTGNLDDIGIWNRALTQEEIKYISTH